jgi:hypothetical protein
MPTLRRRAFVSMIATLSLSLTAAACSQAAARGGRSPVDDVPLAIRFDNDAREHVHVYLINEKREWLLGRVEAGAIAMLRIPEESLAGNPTFVRMVVIAGEGVTLQAARHAGATPTLAQPVSDILSQRWRFSAGSLTSLKR